MSEGYIEKEKMVQTTYKEKAFHHKDHQTSEKVAQTSHAVAHPWRLSRIRKDKILKTWSVLIADHALRRRWTRCFPEVSSKLNFPVILQMRVTKTRGLTSEFLLLPLPVFHEDKAFPSSKLIDYLEANSVGNLYIFFYWMLMHMIFC